MSKLTHIDLMHTNEDRAIMSRARAYLPSLYVGHNPNEAREFTPASFVAQVMIELDRAEVCKLAGLPVLPFKPTYSAVAA
jgi:hypothetical protein